RRSRRPAGLRTSEKRSTAGVPQATRAPRSPSLPPKEHKTPRLNVSVSVQRLKYRCSEVAAGFEPAYTALQAVASPLGHATALRRATRPFGRATESTRADDGIRTRD